MWNSTALVAMGLCLASLLLPSVATAQQSQVSAPTHMDSRAVVTEVRRIISERYVLPERRPALDAVLTEGLASGRYDITDPRLLAERINDDLVRVGQDRHLSFVFDRQRAALLTPSADRTAPDPEAFLRAARANNHGFSEMRLLPGNIRYLAYDAFTWVGLESAAAIDNAMRFLADGDAVIIDLRRNGGGDASAVQYLVSHFLPADQLLSTSYVSWSPEPQQMFTLSDLSVERMVGKPLYVLISNSTGSAAEAFAGVVAGHHIGTLIGETTNGAGFRNMLVPIDGRFVLSVSVARVVLASTQRDWEAVGIPPTTQTTVATALDVAHVQALRQIRTQGHPDQPLALDAIAEVINARLVPHEPALPFTAYEGEFGTRTITSSNGKLYYQREGAARIALIPLGGNRFAFDDTLLTVQLNFVVTDNRATALELSSAGVPQGRYARTR